MAKKRKSLSDQIEEIETFFSMKEYIICNDVPIWIGDMPSNIVDGKFMDAIKWIIDEKKDEIFDPSEFGSEICKTKMNMVLLDLPDQVDIGIYAIYSEYKELERICIHMHLNFSPDEQIKSKEKELKSKYLEYIMMRKLSRND